MIINEKQIANLKKKARKIRSDILEISFKGNAGHIASALSITDILTVLYHGILKLNPKNPLMKTRDRFILSKGHAGSALFATLFSCGFVSRKMLMSFCQDNGVFGVHPKYDPKHGIEITTGSLGHGLSIGIGMALSLKKTKEKNPARVFVLMSDAELNEGSSWESIMFAGHHKLDNIVVIIDDNGNQAFGKTSEVLDLAPFLSKFISFGWMGYRVNGHNVKELLDVFSSIPIERNKPTVIVAKTISGKGVRFMEGRIEWHYLNLDQLLYKKAQREIANEKL